VLCGVVAWFVTQKNWKSTLALFAVVLTHPLLDSLTDGGLGVALFWPFTAERYFAPWTPIPVAPIGLGMFSRYGAYVLFAEAAVAVPLVALAHFLTPKAPATSARSGP
jgi:inner membrane protein